MQVARPNAPQGAVPAAYRSVVGQADQPRGLLVLFIITLLIPISFEIAGVRLSPTRLLLLIMAVPAVITVLSSARGPVSWTDKFFLFHGVWIFVALIVSHGFSRIPFAGITMVELVGGYFLGRLLIRDAASYRYLFKVILICLICLLPFAVYESFTGKLVIPDLLRPFFDTPERVWSAYGRLGLERVYGVFDHPILWGFFCAMTLSNFIMLAQGHIGKILFALTFSLYTTFLSLSSAPVLACALQLGLLAWGWIMGERWKLLIILSSITYVVVDLLSNRTPITIMIETLTFNPHTGWIRLAIYDYGWAAVLSNPIFGIGFNDWPRPSWLTSSVDNFWLLSSMRYGLVGACFIMLAFLMHFVSLLRAQVTDPEIMAMRVGHAVALVGVSFTLITVHVWDTTAVFVMFYLGAGAWIYTRPGPEHSQEEAEATGLGTVPAAVAYSRFPPKKRAASSASDRPMQARIY